MIVINVKTAIAAIATMTATSIDEKIIENLRESLSAEDTPEKYAPTSLLLMSLSG